MALSLQFRDQISVAHFGFEVFELFRDLVASLPRCLDLRPSAVPRNVIARGRYLSKSAPQSPTLSADSVTVGCGWDSAANAFHDFCLFRAQGTCLVAANIVLPRVVNVPEILFIWL